MRELGRRQLLQLGGLAAAGTALSGCLSAEQVGQAGGPQTQLAPEGSPGGEITILDDNANTIFEPLVEEFQRQTGVRVKSYSMGNFNDLHDRFATLFSAHDDSVDVIMTWAGWSAEFGQAGWLQELDPSAVPQDLIQPALDAVTWQDKVYGLPKFASVQTMFWSKPQFERAGLDPERGPERWDDFVDAAKALTTDEQYGFACDLGNAAGAYQNFLRVLLLNGGTMYDEDFRPVFNSEEGVEALTRLVELLQLHKVMDPASVQITNASDLADLFGRNRTGMVFNWPSQWGVVADDEADLKSDQVGNGLIPGMGVRSASIDGSEGYAINRYSKNKQGALAWLQFASSPQVQRRLVAEEGWFPVSQEVLDDPESVRELPVLTTYKESTQYESKRFGVPWSSELDQIISVQMSDAMAGRTSPKDALDATARQTQVLVDKYFVG